MNESHKRTYIECARGIGSFIDSQTLYIDRWSEKMRRQATTTTM